GRTDAGVHARGQVLHFDINNNKINVRKTIYSLNSLLPDDISISEIVEVTDKFHAQKSATYRYYRYKIANRLQRNAFDRNLLHLREELDLDLMNEALSFLVGEHDFSCFKAAKTENPAKICNMYYAKASRSGDYIYIDFIANRFLYNMVRIIVGTVLDIGRKKFTPQFINELLISKDRTKASQTVSPTGLTLMFVGYGDISSKDFEDLILSQPKLEEQLLKTANYLAIKEA
ncbi:MAG: tRNA pseudouridine(38-40) synthase TruA, partial [Candidatus Gastranaerophilales bacterium]|nr:tRNA pseudouridine(38-40) synthase TruA [Candidatus Gastranaerophilales bacterium]